MECHKTSGKMVVTIFYEVKPSHVRKQKGEFGKAYKKTCKKKTEEEKQRWDQALTDVSNILGEYSPNWLVCSLPFKPLFLFFFLNGGNKISLSQEK